MAHSPSHVNQVIYLVPVGDTLICVWLELKSALAVGSSKGSEREHKGGGLWA
jgi:hypothetical protein